MATFPCMQCQQRFGGEAFNVYLQTYKGQSRASLRKIVCPACRLDLLAGWEQLALFRNASGEWEDLDPEEGLEGAWIDAGGPSGWPTSRR